MGNPQKIKFRDVADFLSYLSGEEALIVDQLRSIVLDCLGDRGEERLSYNAPFYHYHGQLCLIWPASVPWGRVDAGVALSFVQGKLLSDCGTLLELQDRKTIARKIYHHAREIDREQVEAWVFEAMAINEDLKASKKHK